MEPILIEPHNKFVMMKPIYPNLHQLYVKARDSYWTPEEVDLTADLHDWNNKLNNNEKKFIKNILSFFSSSDSIVQDNLAARFMQEVKINEAKSFYAIQIAIEQIHQESYSKMLTTYVTDTAELNQCFDAVLHDGSIKKKADWAIKWINDQADFAYRLVAFAIVEGIYFSSSFAAIYWLKNRNLMPGLCIFNDFISRDEGLHCEFAIMLFSLLRNKPLSITDMIQEAVNIECEFVKESLQTPLIGMRDELMCDYVKFCADRLLLQLGYTAIYNASCPFPFMEQIGLSNKTNFFEHRVSEYAKVHYCGDDDDF